MSLDYLELEDLLIAAELFLGHAPEVRNYGLLERLGWFGVVTFYELNGRPVRIVDDSPFETIMAIARGELVDVPAVANILRGWTTP